MSLRLPFITILWLVVFCIRLVAASYDLTAREQGWFNAAGQNGTAWHGEPNTNYWAGRDGTTTADLCRNFFSFDLSGVPADEEITSATLTLNAGGVYPVGDTSETWKLTSIETTPLAGISASNSGGQAIYEDLGSGTDYGSHAFQASEKQKDVTVVLNSAFSQAAAPLQGKPSALIGIGGYISTLDMSGAVPEGVFGSTGSFARLHIKTQPAIPIIQSAATATGNVGSAFSYQITAAWAPTSFGALNLPVGLSVNASTGLISGTPTEAGLAQITLQATNRFGTGTQMLTLTILPPPPAITSGAEAAAGRVGDPFSWTITATHSPTSFAATGLPPGLVINTTTGIITGTPTYPGDFTVTVRASNVGGSGSQSLHIPIAPIPPIISSALTTSGQMGVGFDFLLAALNVPTSFSATGLPSGLTINSATGRITGTPQAYGEFPVQVSASNAAGIDTKTLTISLLPPAPAITSATTASGQVGVGFSYQIIGGPEVTRFGADGLPAGLTVNSETGLIFGIPTTASVSMVTLQVFNAGGSGSRSLTLTVLPTTPVISSADTVNATVGVAFSYSITASSDPTSFGATNLPPGLTVSSGTGVISGTPSVLGTTSTTISATNAGGTGSRTLAITVLPPPPVITSTAVMTGNPGVPLTYQINATNSPTLFAATGLPSGLSLNSQTGLISGTPAITSKGVIHLFATNDGGTGTYDLTYLLGKGIECASLAADGGQANGASICNQISPDGRYVLFCSFASNLVPGDTNGRSDVFLRDRTLDTTERVSVATSGTQGNSSVDSTFARMSADARYIVFSSDASNFVPNDTNNAYDVFLRDRLNQTTVRVNTGPGGVQASTWSFSGRCTISGDGSTIAYESDATNLVTGDTNGRRDIFAFNRLTGVTTMVNTAANGALPAYSGPYHGSYNPSVSADGRYVAFLSDATNLVSNDTNSQLDCFRKDRTSGEVIRVSVSSAGDQSSGLVSVGIVISADGDAIGFVSTASDLAGSDTNGRNDVFLRRVSASTTQRISVGPSGQESSMDSEYPGISPDGSRICFSFGNSLLPGLTVGSLNIFGRESAPNRLILISATAGGYATDGTCKHASLSSDGSLVAFDADDGSIRRNLIPGDTNGYSDIFVATNPFVLPPAPLISSATSATGEVGISFIHQITASHSPTLYTAAGLPTGISLNNTTGRITGIPQVAGAFAVTLTAQNDGGTGTQTLTLQIAAVPPVLDLSQDPGHEVGNYFSYNIAATNWPSSYTATGLPPGMTLNASTGIINGQPTQSGTYDVAVSATNQGGTASGTVRLVVYPHAPEVGMAYVDAQMRMPFTWQIAATNEPTSYSATGLPQGLSVNPATGVISGAAVTAGEYHVQISATNHTGTHYNVLHLTVTTAPRTATRLNISPAGEQANGGIYTGYDSFFSMSADAQWIAFASNASNLVPDDTNGVTDVFVKNRTNGTVERVSVGTGGTQSTLNCYAPAISGDGRWVAFVSSPTNFGGSPSGLSLVRLFLRDRLNHTTTILTGTEGGFKPALSDDGRYLVFGSRVALDNQDTNTVSDVFLYDRVASTVSRLSKLPDGTAPPRPIGFSQGSTQATISGDGRYVAFSSDGLGLIQGDTGGFTDAILLDRTTGVMRNVSASKTGGLANSESYPALVSADGNYVFFVSAATNIDPSVTSSSPPFLYRRKLSDNSLTLVSATVNGGAFGHSGNGRYAISASSPLRVNDVNNARNITAVVQASGGVSTSDTLGPILSRDGRWIVFVSSSTSLVGGDTNGVADLFIVANALYEPPAPVVTSSAQATGAVGQTFTYQTTASNEPASYTATGLPDGLAFDPANGLISGTPAAAGVFSITLSATNNGGTGTATLSLTVAPAPPSFSGELAATGQVGVSFNYTPTGVSGAQSFAAAALPPGLGIRFSDGWVSGIPQTAGEFLVILTATNGSGTASGLLRLTISPALPQITNSPSVNAIVGSPFSFQITATNQPASFAASPMPAGLILQPGTGLISGTPIEGGAFQIQLSATNSAGTGHATLTLNISHGAPVFPTSLVAGGMAGHAFSYQLRASGNPTGYTASGLPLGISLDPETGIISGTPVAAGSSNIAIRATNAAGTGNGSLQIVIATSLETWSEDFPPGTPPEQMAPEADANHNGVSNLMEYALGSEPTATGLPQLPVLTLNNEEGTLTFSFPQVRDDITYTVESSPDLKNWSPIATSPAKSSQNGSVTIPQPPFNNLYLRLSVTRIP
ncbi:MAG: putative Ig domain-containing protein [Verrucomicrobiales bacterium]|nr:putative Ig domain-containing protein [Verrucomicrobiales bacterium]